MGIIIAIIVFSLIIIFHELGHFTLAKLNGIRVEEFSLGLGPTLFGKTIKGTKFSLKLLPFGGACMMGEDDVEDQAEGSFNSKSVWARISVIVAGPVFNFIMALVLSVIMVAWIGYTEPVISDVSEGYSAEEQGMQAGDRIVKLGNTKIRLWEDISLYNLTHSGETVDVTYERDGQEYAVTLEPKKSENGAYMLGVVSPKERTKGNVIESIQHGFYTMEYWIKYTIECLKMLVTGQVGINQMSGPVGVVSIMDSTYKQSIADGIKTVVLSFMNIAILLSANLGVMNLLPIPALDGGRLVFLFIEAIRRKRVPPEKEGMVHFAGLVALLLLMVVIMYNDIQRLI